MTAKFGPAGNSDAYAAAGYKGNVDAPEFVSSIGLDAYEYQCGRGVRVNEKTAQEFRSNAERFDVAVSLHSPYYISLSSIEEEKRMNSIGYILDSAKAVKMLGGNRVVVHSGSCAKISREQALELSIDTVKKALNALDENGLSDIRICPETMGKLNQLGTLDEVIEICKLDERLIPCIDFGHLNARTLGSIKTIDDYHDIIKSIGNSLGEYRMKNFHAHFSKIEYTDKGEKKHLTFADSVYGPDPEPLCELIAKYDLCPTIICESSGTQSDDALFMKQSYKHALGI